MNREEKINFIISLSLSVWDLRRNGSLFWILRGEMWFLIYDSKGEVLTVHFKE